MRSFPSPDSVLVVVPARDEARRIAATVGSIAVALREVQCELPHQHVVVVADGCVDDTAALARRAWGTGHGMSVLTVPGAGVGAARRVGAAVGLAELGAVRDRVWIATTDADTRVPPGWLVRQLRWAARGYDAVAGAIRVTDWTAGDFLVRERYERMLAEARRPGGTHADVFGANLGLRAAVLADVGGFPRLRVGEDHAVWDALLATGFAGVNPTDVVVTTSGRRHGRAVGGLADLLDSLA